MLHIPSALFYAFMSILMVFGNKYLLSNWNFNNPVFLILIEMILNVGLILAVSKSQLAKASRVSIDLYAVFNLHGSTKYQYSIVVFYCLHSILSLKALSGLNIPMYIMFKRCVPLINLLLSIFVFRNVNVHEAHTQKIIASIVLMTFGVVVAGVGDIDFDLKSYLYCASSVICQAFYLSSIQKHGETIGQKTSHAHYHHKSSLSTLLQSLYDCSALSIPILALLFVFTEEPAQVGQALGGHGEMLLKLYAFISIVILSGSLLCFSQFWCTLNNNAITTSVLGVLKSIVQTFLGIYMFSSWRDISNLTYVGMLINFSFGIYYTYLKYKENSKRTPVGMDISLESDQEEKS
jgi:solute carrier family 35 protein